MDRSFDSIKTSDVKEFIRRLKEEFNSYYVFTECDETVKENLKMIWKQIDKLAGEKLK